MRLRILLVAVPLAILAVACGGSDDSSDAASEDTTTTAAEETIDVAAFCETAARAQALGQGPQFDPDATPEERQQTLDEFNGQADELLTQLESQAPEELAEPIAVIAAAVRSNFDTGDGAFTDDPNFIAADTEADEYMLASCDAPVLEVTATDGAFEGFPETMPSGLVAITLTNDGQEPHQAVLLRVNDGVDDTVLDLLIAQQMDAPVTFSGFVGAVPGQTDTTFVLLDEARYGAVCFVPQGTTADGPEGSGPPHFLVGELSEFTVTS